MPCVGSSEASKKTLIASEQETQRVKDLRFAHRLWRFTIDPRNLVFLDETGMHLGFTCLYGRSPKGERVYDSETPGDSGQNIALIGGLSLDGLIATIEYCRQRQYRRVLVLHSGDSDTATVGGRDRLDG